MEYQTMTVVDVILRFLMGWTIAGFALVMVSCVKYREFIVSTVADTTWLWVNGLMPTVIMLIGIGYMIKAVFR